MWSATGVRGQSTWSYYDRLWAPSLVLPICVVSPSAFSREMRVGSQPKITLSATIPHHAPQTQLTKSHKRIRPRHPVNLVAIALLKLFRQLVQVRECELAGV